MAALLGHKADSKAQEPGKRIPALESGSISRI